MTIAPLEPADALEDSELALAAARGDRLAFSAIYDRYADRLHDFCAGMLRDRDAAADCVQDAFVIAASKLTQLEDPNRLRAWLYAIARHEALARIKDRRRVRPSDELPELPSDDPDLATLVARNELADLIEHAFGGLSDRDRTVYELAYRQGLDAYELADALGVSYTNANTLVGRLRDGIERSLGAMLVCRRVKADPAACSELSQLVESWDGTFTVLMRKRVARHIDRCASCDSERRRMVSPAALLGAVPVLLPAPAWLRDDTLREATAELPAPDCRVADAEPWWPPRDIDVRESASPTGLSTTHKRFVRAALLAALALLSIAGLAQLSAPMNPGVEPAGAPVEPSTTTSAQIFSIAGVSPSSPTVPVTTSAAVATTRVEPLPNATVEQSTPTVTTSAQPPAQTSTSRAQPNNSFTPSRISATAARPVTRTSEPTTTSRVTGTMTVNPIPAESTTTTPPSDPIE